MPDKTLTCRDCSQSFVFTTSEQEFHASKGYTNEPGRCPTCRSARQDRRGPNSGGGYGGGSGGYQRREQQMFPAVCAQCGKDTQVPFQPRGDRPVYCSTCYETQRGTSSGPRRGAR
jgi:CxxC-x17-CxxC domain-containing protein